MDTFHFESSKTFTFHFGIFHFETLTFSCPGPSVPTPLFGFAQEKPPPAVEDGKRKRPSPFVKNDEEVLHRKADVFQFGINGNRSRGTSVDSGSLARREGDNDDSVEEDPNSGTLKKRVRQEGLNMFFYGIKFRNFETLKFSSFRFDFFSFQFETF